MPRANPVRSAKIEETLCVRIDKIASTYGIKSFNQAAEIILEQMVDLIEADPAQRKLPPICAAIDAIKTTRATPFPSSKVADLAAQAAADALSRVQAQKKR